MQRTQKRRANASVLVPGPRMCDGVCVRQLAGVCAIFACVCVEAGTANETEPKIASREQEQRTKLSHSGPKVLDNPASLDGCLSNAGLPILFILFIFLVLRFLHILKETIYFLNLLDFLKLDLFNSLV